MLLLLLLLATKQRDMTLKGVTAPICRWSAASLSSSAPYYKDSKLHYTLDNGYRYPSAFSPNTIKT